MQNWKIRFFLPDISEEEENAVLIPLRNKWLTMGEKTHAFEKAFAQKINTSHAYAVSGGSAALHLALMALNVQPGDEVLVPSLTFVACSNVIVAAGATPVFVDVCDHNDWTISPQDIERKITNKTRGMIIVHYAGFACRIKEIQAIAQKHGLFIIEDCAHAVITSVDGQYCGTFGDVGCFSFYSNKNLTAGEGGMVITQNEELAQRLKILRSHGMTSMPADRFQGKTHSYDIQGFGLNYRIDDMRSSIAMCQLQKLDKNLRLRTRVYQSYLNKLSQIDSITIPFQNRNAAEATGYHIFPVLVETSDLRDKLIEGLKQQGIQTSFHYPPIHQFSIYQSYLKGQDVACPITEEVTSREITLPFYPSMSDDDIQTVCDSIQQCLKS